MENNPCGANTVGGEHYRPLKLVQFRALAEGWICILSIFYTRDEINNRPHSKVWPSRQEHLFYPAQAFSMRQPSTK